MRMSYKVLVVCSALCAAVARPALADVANGSFETGDFTGWTISGNAVVNPFYATDGVNSVHFNYGNVAPTAVLSQSVATLPGHNYTLGFDFGVRSFSAATQILKVEVIGIGPLVSTFVSDASPSEPPTFGSFAYSFVADGPSVTLRFTDLASNPTTACDGILDNVHLLIDDPVPTQAVTWGLLKASGWH